jgi:hypothetical protein
VKHHQNPGFSIWFSLTSALLLGLASACSLPRSPLISSGQNNSGPFVPPTIVPSSPPNSLVNTSTPDITASSTATNCLDQLAFIKDLSLPDGTHVRPGSILDKRWEIKNSGACNWDERYHIKLVAGPGMGAAEEQALYPARSGSQVEIHILFTAPQQPGIYRSAWQAVSPAGEVFGDPFFIEVIVDP